MERISRFCSQNQNPYEGDEKEGKGQRDGRHQRGMKWTKREGEKCPRASSLGRRSKGNEWTFQFRFQKAIWNGKPIWPMLGQKILLKLEGILEFGLSPISSIEFLFMRTKIIIIRIYAEFGRSIFG
jgi:hypothetical protein